MRRLLLPELEYVRPSSVTEAVGLLNSLPDAGLLAGGQSLINVLKMRIGGYRTLIDISGLAELAVIDHAQGHLRIGAGVTYDQLIHSAAVSLYRPILSEVAARIADQQVRNRGTIGGNCCYNDPTCHFPPILSAVGASFEILGTEGRRTVSADEFFVSYYQTALNPGEMLVAIEVPEARPRSGDAFVPLSVGGTDVLNVVTGAASVLLAEDGSIRDARIVVSGVAERPLRIAAVEQALLGTRGDGDALDAAFRLWDGNQLTPPDDVHASGEYRLAMAPVFARRAVEEALVKARRDFDE